jgi:hypothetical protein
MVQEYTGRFMFMEALQLEHKKFFSDLREVMAKPDEIVRWMTRVGVVDEWLIEIVWDTLWFWARNPDSPRLRLEPGHRWFRYALLEDERVQIPMFDPLFSLDPVRSSTGQPEDREQLIARVCSQFESQLRQFLRYMDSITGDDCPGLKRHAQWTAMAFAGMSYVRIAGQFTNVGVKAYSPDDVVKMAVRRFSKRIGLTLPGRQARG